MNTRNAASVAVALSSIAGTAYAAAEPVRADVVVIVDTSISMKDPGMDPERASLLVTKLLSDIVPGELAVVRLLDLAADRNILPSRDTGETIPCSENPALECKRVDPAVDWAKHAKNNRLGVLARPALGDLAYKSALDRHLAQSGGNSLFHLAFRAAEGVFEEHASRAPGDARAPRVVVWLSDGRSDSPKEALAAIEALQAKGVSVEALVLGNGDTRLAQEAKLRVSRVSRPSEIMNAFADVFRRIVQAPYKIGGEIDSAPRFQMKKYVDEAWVVVYGDKTLGEVTLQGPSGTLLADYAHDVFPSAGAYRVAHLSSVPPGEWTIRASGGGKGVSYAVVQRSSLGPVLIEPKTAASGGEALLVAGISATGAELIQTPEVIAEIQLEAELEGTRIPLYDDGTHGDAAAHDGRYSAPVRFEKEGEIRVRVHAGSEILDRWAEGTVHVSGVFRNSGAPVELDFGELGPSASSCRSFAVTAVHQGTPSFELATLRELPSGHELELRAPAGRLRADRGTLQLPPGGPWELCLSTAAGIGSSAALGEPWAALRVVGTTDSEHSVPFKLRWKVTGLPFAQRWCWLLRLLLVAFTALFVICGYIVPARFTPGLGVIFVSEYSDLEEQPAQPVKQWKGVGIGFYRDARAYLHANYRLSRNARGALASLQATAGGTLVVPGREHLLYRETIDGEWQAASAKGQAARGGDVYRVDEKGPYFRVSSAKRGRS